MTASEIEALGGYYGATPKPADFEAFWQARMAEADAVPLDYTVTQAKEAPSWDGCDFLDLWFTGMAGARIYAKYLRPHSDKPVPLVLQFHGYPGASRSFAEQASFAGMGMALIAMDCPGQAGYSVDVGGFLGRTAGFASWAISTAKTLPPWCSARCCLARDWRMSSARPRHSAPSTTICTAKKSGIFSPVTGTRRLQNLTICC